MANHHYVPKAILRHFCFEGERLYYFSKRTRSNGVEPRNINSVFKKRNLNSFLDESGLKHEYLEDFFSHNFDNEINSLICFFSDCAIRQKIRFPTKKSHARFVQFFYNHMKRTPDFHEPIVEEATREIFFEKSIDELSEIYGPFTKQEEKLITDPAFRKRVIDRSRVENLGRQAFHILDKMASMSVCLGVPHRYNKQFVVGSTPVVRFQDREKQKLGERGVELWTAITPRLAVGLVAKELGSHVLQLNDEAIRKFNLETVRIGNGIASKNQALLKSICRYA